MADSLFIDFQPSRGFYFLHEPHYNSSLPSHTVYTIKNYKNERIPKKLFLLFSRTSFVIYRAIVILRYTDVICNIARGINEDGVLFLRVS